MIPTSVPWDNKKSLRLISQFKQHEVLWNPNIKAFHDNKKKEEAWCAIAREFKEPSSEIKKRIVCLRGSYRRERSRIIRSRKEGKEEYKSKWFAFKSLAFLDEIKQSGNSVIENFDESMDVTDTNITTRPSMQNAFNNAEFNKSDDVSSSATKKRRVFGSSAEVKEPECKPMEQRTFILFVPTKHADVSDSSKVGDNLATATKPSPFGGRKIDDEVASKSTLSNGLEGPPPMVRCMGMTVNGKRIMANSQRKLFTSNSPSTSISNANTTVETAVEPVTENSRPLPLAHDDKSSENKSSKNADDKEQDIAKNCDPEEDQDECAVFGQLVESTLRNLSGTFRVEAKMKLSQVLWEVELEALRHNPFSKSYVGLQKPSPAQSPSISQSQRSKTNAVKQAERRKTKMDEKGENLP